MSPLTGFALSVLIETPILLIGLSDKHGWPRRLFAGIWLTGCSYPVVALTLPFVFPADRSRIAHLLTAETFAHYNQCTSCGACERACPRGLIRLIPFKAEQMTVIACNSRDSGMAMRNQKICRVGCIGCGACVRAGGEVFQMTVNLAVIDYQKYDALAELAPVAAKCPVKVIRTVGPDDSTAVRPKSAPLVKPASESTAQLSS